MNPLMSAEQAVLGAALLDPEQLTHLEWLAADHFYRPVHQALFDALRKLRNDGHPALSADGPLPLSWVTDAVEEAGQHVRGLTAAYAHTLIQACPRTEHAPVYGRMVLEGRFTAPSPSMRSVSARQLGPTPSRARSRERCARRTS